MSIASWKREFYSPISKCKKADALAHVLKKYLGTRPAVLKRHGVRKVGRRLYDNEGEFDFSGATCALCKFYCKGRICRPKCPLVIESGSGEDCDATGSLWRLWTKTGDPEPLIRALRRAIKKQAAARS